MPQASTRPFRIQFSYLSDHLNGRGVVQCWPPQRWVWCRRWRCRDPQNHNIVSGSISRGLAHRPQVLHRPRGRSSASKLWRLSYHPSHPRPRQRGCSRCALRCLGARNYHGGPKTTSADLIAKHGASAAGYWANLRPPPVPPAMLEPPLAEDVLAATSWWLPPSKSDLPSAEGRDTNLRAVLGGASGSGGGSCSGAP